MCIFLTTVSEHSSSLLPLFFPDPLSLSFLFPLLTLPSSSLLPSSFLLPSCLFTWPFLPLSSLLPSLNLPPSCHPYTFTPNFPSILSVIVSSFLWIFFLFLIPFFINITQGMAAIMPAMVIVGLAKTIPTLYMGLTLFSFGKSYFHWYVTLLRTRIILFFSLIIMYK